MRKAYLGLLITLVCCRLCNPGLAIARDKPNLGASLAASAELPSNESYSCKYGALIRYIAPDSPAAKANFQVGDVIIALDGKELAVKSHEVVKAVLDYFRSCKIGQTVRITIIRFERKKVILKDGQPVNASADAYEDFETFAAAQADSDHYSFKIEQHAAVLTREVRLSKRSIGQGSKVIPGDEVLHPEMARAAPHEIAAIADRLVAHYGIGEQYADLRKRLSELEVSGDPFRRNAFAYVHRNPFRMGIMAENIFCKFSPGPELEESGQEALRECGRLLDLSPESWKKPPLKTGLSLDDHLGQLETLLLQSARDHKAAFRNLSADEIDFLHEHLDSLIDVFEEHIYIHIDQDRKRFQNNLKIIELAAKVDYGKLLHSAASLLRISRPEYLQALAIDLQREGHDLYKPVIGEKNTLAGKIIIGGLGDNWYQKPEQTGSAIIIDLGGNDFYSDQVATSRPGVPASIVVDVNGDDAYESAKRYAQGCGRLGVGILADMGGDDSYLGLSCCQGAGILGIGLLADQEGNDTYRADSYAQACSFWGTAGLIDARGDDRYEAHRYSQAVAIAGSIAFLVEGGGNDSYYSKGRGPTNYGTPGIFDSWSQGCGLGIRDYVSGGIAVLHDLGGSDRMEAGNFSQGGGYYFGWGMLKAGGNEDDTYLASRYAHGFSAHYAGGTFIEEGGNDRYPCRNAVGSGLAWDLSVTWFEDRGGDDIYTRRGFSKGAAAHNSITVFIDHAGTDDYLGSECAPVSSNNYHGGCSLSLFFDLGKGTDKYKTDINKSMLAQGEYSFLFDLPGGPWRTVTRGQA